MGKRKSATVPQTKRKKRLIGALNTNTVKETPLDESLVVEGRGKISLLEESVSNLLAFDRKCVSLEWQTDKKQKTQQKGKKPEVPDGETPTRNGLHRWKAADALFPDRNTTSFGALHLNDALCKSLKDEMRFGDVTEVQRLLIPSILEGHDVICGGGGRSGKTVGYVLPIIHTLMTQEPRIRRSDGTRVIILCPDVRRCEAVADLMSGLLKRLCWWITCSVFAGGENRNHEKSRLRKGVTVMVTTETRLMDHLENTSAFRADGVRTFVVDGASELLYSKRGGKLRRANQILQEACCSSGNERMQNVICTDACHPELAFLCLCMLQDPVSIGFEFSKGRDRYWTATAVEGWDLKEHKDHVDGTDGRFPARD